MSYVLQIWEHPTTHALPATVQEAEAFTSALQGINSVQNPKFITFAKKLTRKYPCMTESDESVWTDGPLDGQTDEPVYGIGIQTEYLHEVHPFVITTANALGLSVYDDQAGQAYLASGNILTMPGDKPFVPAKRPVSEFNKKSATERAFHCFTVHLEKHGYKPLKSKLTFKRRFPGGFQDFGDYYRL